MWHTLLYPFKFLYAFSIANWQIWLPYLVGFCYATIAGHFLINLVMVRMWKCIDLKGNSANKIKGDDWQPPVTGILERTLYVSSLIMSHGEFIGFWIALKVASQWKRWSKGIGGRTIYMNSLIGSGISILYAVVGFKIITYIKENHLGYLFTVPLLLPIATFILWYWLKRYIKNI